MIGLSATIGRWVSTKRTGHGRAHTPSAFVAYARAEASAWRPSTTTCTGPYWTLY